MTKLPGKKGIVREPVSLYDAKTQLSSLVDRASAGEEFVITKSGKPRALLVPLTDTRPLRVSGKGRGKWKVRRDFDAPLPDDILKAFSESDP
jgi:prevent-host-death family protein